jgi:hypothetical protein
MGRKVRRVPFHLDSKDIQDLPFDEIKWILRGADNLIMRGGRNLLAKLLKGSKDKKILERQLDKNPAYGYLHQNTIEEITAKIDWMILKGYLDIEYDYRLPLLAYTRKGWEIEMDTYTDELLAEFDRLIAGGQKHFLMTHLKDRNREMILLLLDKVEATGDPGYFPLLKDWAEIDYKKVKKRINSVIRNIGGKTGNDYK